VGTVIALAGLGFVAGLMVRERETLAALLREPRAGWLAAALLAGLAGMTGIGLAWGAILRRLDRGLPLPETLRGYFVGQLGKYVPGGVWGVVGRGEWARRGGVAPVAAYSSALLSMVTAYLAACTVALACLPWGARGGGAGATALAVGLLGPAGLALLHPRVTGPVLAVIERLVRRPIGLRVPAWSASAGFVARQLPSWVLIGAATWATARGLGVELDPVAVLLATCVSWVVGFLVIPVPGGIGVREAAFVALLAPDGAIAAVALSARLVFVVVDLTGAAAASLWVAWAARRRARDAGS
jgi:hypothetical protein